MRDKSAEPLEATVRLLEGLLRRTHLSTPADLPKVVAEQAATIGAGDVEMYLADYELDALVPVSGRTDDGPLSIAGTVAGRAFSTTAILRTADEPESERLWLPLLDGTERLGTLGMTFPSEHVSDALVATCERYAHLVAILLVSKGAFGDTLEVARRSKPMTIAAELVRALAPPLAFATDDLILAGMLEPAYDSGGDALDYAVNGRTLHVGVFDAMGHGLAAAGVAAFALAAYRNSRRAGHDLLETHAAMDEAVWVQYPDNRFVTALIAELDLDSGAFAWVSAGHPPPLRIRNGRRARSLTAEPAPPLGVRANGAPPRVRHEPLEPGDLVLVYTDGIVDARSRHDARFTLEDISGFIEREVSAGQTAPETLRRFRHAMLHREQAELRDDATALLVEWRSGAERRLVPETVLV